MFWLSFYNLHLKSSLFTENHLISFKMIDFSYFTANFCPLKLLFLIFILNLISSIGITEPFDPTISKVTNKCEWITMNSQQKKLRKKREKSRVDEFEKVYLIWWIEVRSRVREETLFGRPGDRKCLIIIERETRRGKQVSTVEAAEMNGDEEGRGLVVPSSLRKYSSCVLLEQAQLGVLVIQTYLWTCNANESYRNWARAARGILVYWSPLPQTEPKTIVVNLLLERFKTDWSFCEKKRTREKCSLLSWCVLPSFLRLSQVHSFISLTPSFTPTSLHLSHMYIFNTIQAPTILSTRAHTPLFPMMTSLRISARLSIVCLFYLFIIFFSLSTFSSTFFVTFFYFIISSMLCFCNCNSEKLVSKLEFLTNVTNVCLLRIISLRNK